MVRSDHCREESRSPHPGHSGPRLERCRGPGLFWAAVFLCLEPGATAAEDLPGFLKEGAAFPLHLKLTEELQYHGDDGPVGDPLSSYRTLVTQADLRCRVLSAGSAAVQLEADVQSGELSLEIRGREIVDPRRWAFPIDGLRLRATLRPQGARVVVDPGAWQRRYRAWRRGLSGKDVPSAKSLASDSLEARLGGALGAVLTVQKGLWGFRGREGRLFSFRRSLEPLVEGPAGEVEVSFDRPRVLMWGEAFAGRLYVVYTGRRGERIPAEGSGRPRRSLVTLERTRRQRPEVGARVCHLDWKEVPSGGPAYLRLELDMEHHDPGVFASRDVRATYRLRILAGPGEYDWPAAPLRARMPDVGSGSPSVSTTERESSLTFYLRRSNRDFLEFSERLGSGTRDVDEILESYARIEEQAKGTEPGRALLHFLLAARLVRIAYQDGHEEARAWVERALRNEKRLALFVLALRVVSDPFSFLTDAQRVERLEIAAMRDDPELARWGGMLLGIGFEGAGEAIADVLLEREVRGRLPPELERSLWIDLERAAGDEAREIYKRRRREREARESSQVAAGQGAEGSGRTAVVQRGGKETEPASRRPPPIPGERVVFLVPVEGGPQGEKEPYGRYYTARPLERVKGYFARALGRLRSEHRFAVVTYDSVRTGPWRRSLEAAKPRVLRQAIGYVKSLRRSRVRGKVPRLTPPLKGFGRLDTIVVAYPRSSVPHRELNLWNTLRGTRFLVVDWRPEWGNRHLQMHAELNHGWYDTTGVPELEGEGGR